MSHRHAYAWCNRTVIIFEVLKHNPYYIICPLLYTRNGYKMQAKQDTHDLRSKDERRQKSPNRPERSYKNQKGGNADTRHDRNDSWTIDTPGTAVTELFHLWKIHHQVQDERRIDSHSQKGNGEQISIGFASTPQCRIKVSPSSDQESDNNPSH
jgi:hypothetical protein